MPRPGFAVASREVVATDVKSPDELLTVPDANIAAITALQLWTQVSDRGHNMMLAGTTAVSVDHATAFGGAWAGTLGPDPAPADQLIQGRLDRDPSLYMLAAASLGQVPEESIASLIRSVPSCCWPAPPVASRQVFMSCLMSRRQRVVAFLSEFGGRNP